MKLNVRITLIVGLLLVVVRAVAMGAVAVWQIRQTGKMVVSRIEKLATVPLHGYERTAVEGRNPFALNRWSEKRDFIRSQVQTAVSVLKRA